MSVLYDRGLNSCLRCIIAVSLQAHFEETRVYSLGSEAYTHAWLAWAALLSKTRAFHAHFVPIAIVGGEVCVCVFVCA